jgi:hypothetical protein
MDHQALRAEQVRLLAAALLSLALTGCHWPWEHKPEAQCWSPDVSQTASQLATQETQQAVEKYAEMQGVSSASLNALQYTADLQYQHASAVDHAVHSLTCSAQAHVTISAPGSHHSVSFDVGDFAYTVRMGTLCRPPLPPSRPRFCISSTRLLL